MPTRKGLIRFVAIAAVSGFIAAAAATTSFAAKSPWKKIEVPFEFRAGDTELAAGTYRILARSENGGLVIKIEGSTSQAEVPVVTRLARTTASAVDTNLVFDSVDGKRRLSEVWIPGEDGYLLHGNLAEVEHEHVIQRGEEAN